MIDYSINHKVLVSVIVCTRNRAESLQDTIESILKNGYSHFELILIDQSSDNYIRKKNEKLARLDPRIYYIFMNNRGLAKARNFGVQHSHGEILLMTDDDCLIPPDWITTACRIFDNHPEYSMILGSVIIKSASAPASSSLFFKDEEFKLPLFKPARWGVGPNRALRRKVYEVTGGLDGVLGVGGLIPGNEDSDFTYRTLKAGFRVFHSSDLKVTHCPKEKSTYQDLMYKSRGYCISNGARYMKYMRCGDCLAFFRFIAHWFSWYWDSFFIILNKQKFYRMPKILFIPYFYLLITWWHVKGIFISFLFKVDKKTMKFYIRK